MPRGRSDSVQRDLDAARRIVRRVVGSEDAQLLLYGSRARGDAGPHSDIDLALVPRRSLPPGVLARVREALEDSTIPYRVEIVDLSTVNEDFRRNVLAEGIPWTD